MIALVVHFECCHNSNRLTCHCLNAALIEVNLGLCTVDNDRHLVLLLREEADCVTARAPQALESSRVRKMFGRRSWFKLLPDHVRKTSGRRSWFQYLPDHAQRCSPAPADREVRGTPTARSSGLVHLT